MTETIPILEFLAHWTDWPVVDVRSPSEFVRGHIPGAYNRPLFNDEERARVGTHYARWGRMSSVKLGLDLTAAKYADYIEELHSRYGDQPVLVHCWRGGMRSAAMAWLLEMAGMKPIVLQGGYRSFRNHVLKVFEMQLPLIILGGNTGSGKTAILSELGRLGQQVIDLEGLAHHKGSAFGAIGMPSQPTTEQFENDLFRHLFHLDPARPVWVEDESLSVGSVTIPRSFFLSMGQAPLIVISLEKSKRVERLISEYAGTNNHELRDAILKIQKRLGGEQTTRALQALAAGDMSSVAGILLTYYDKAYSASIQKRPNTEQIEYVPASSADPAENAWNVLERSNTINLIYRSK
jgi:tRNA 2-selenouridine synthase